MAKTNKKKKLRIIRITEKRGKGENETKMFSKKEKENG